MVLIAINGRQLALGDRQPALNRFFAFRAAAAQASFQLRRRTRLEKDGDRIGILFHHLLRTLHVDFQDDPFARVQAGGNRAPQGAVPIALTKNFTALDKLSPLLPVRNSSPLKKR